MLPKDVYFYLTDLVDDVTALNMLSTNKNYHTEENFKRLVYKRYPHLAKHRWEQSWRQFYFEIIHSLRLLKEKFDFPYIPNPNFDPISLYKSNKDYPINLMNIGLNLSTEIGDKSLIDHFLSKGASDLDEAMAVAADKGYMNLVLYFLGKGATDLDRGLVYGAHGGHMDLVNYFLLRGATDLNRALTYAAESGHLDMVKHLVERGADYFYPAREVAIRENHSKVTAYLDTLIPRHPRPPIDIGRPIDILPVIPLSHR